MKKTGVIIFLLAALILSGCYYSFSKKDNITYNEEEITQKNELLVVPSKEVPNDAAESKEKLEALPIPINDQPQAEKKIELTPKEQEQQKEQEEQILEKYKEQFAALQGEYSGKINALIGEAEAEYNAIPKETRDEASLQLGVKYLQKGSTLETECDAKFNAILGQLQAELESNHLSVRGVQVAKEEYESQKNSRRSVLLSRREN